MKQTLALLTAAVAATGLAAQNAPSTSTSIKVATQNGLAVLSTSDYQSGTTTSRGIADGTDVSRGRSLEARTPNGSARASISRRYVRSIGSGAGIFDSGWAASSSGNFKGTACSANGDSTSATCSAHSILVNFDVPENEEVTIVAFYTGSIRGGATGGGMIDIGNDGSNEIDEKNTTTSTTTKKEIKLKAGKDGIDVLLTTMGNAANNGRDRASYESYARVYCMREFKKIECTITAFDEMNDPDNNPKTGCGGDLEATSFLSRTGSTRGIRAVLQNAPASAAGFFLVGAKRQEIGLPGSMCKLLLMPDVVRPFTTNSRGTAVHFLSISASHIGTAYIQDVMVEFNGGALKVSSSNGNEIVCKEQ